MAAPYHATAPEELLSRDKYATPCCGCIEECGSHAKSRQAVCVQRGEDDASMADEFDHASMTG
jgi:hypothetical protein